MTATDSHPGKGNHAGRLVAWIASASKLVVGLIRFSILSRLIIGRISWPDSTIRRTAATFSTGKRSAPAGLASSASLSTAKAMGPACSTSRCPCWVLTGGSPVENCLNVVSVGSLWVKASLGAALPTLGL